MANVQCGKFTLVAHDPRTGNVTFRGKLTPAPGAEWTAVFNEYQATERAIGNLAVARIRGDNIEFEVPESAANATAEVVRRCVEKANPETEKRQADRQRLLDADQQKADAERKRVKDKYRDGL